MKKILITGACGSIGSALAKALAPSHELLLLDLDPLALNRLDDELRASGNEPTLLPFDLWRMNYDRYQKLAHLIAEAHGKLDALIHCATYFTNLTPMEQVSPEVWLQSLQVNLTAVQWLNQSLLPLLQQSQRGQILITTHPKLYHEQSAYFHGFGVSQSALKTLIQEWQAVEGSTRVRVHDIALDWLDTPLSRNVFPAAKALWQRPEQIVHHYLEALS
ncbi:MAG: SDR family NAD(P)-dependent oxidoreductase [Cardiobacteriaceae bacterium]|nr:SDR family NAD(P)-dependent oxidoreductase [Cardiobacteriaceae bacterium]